MRSPMFFPGVPAWTTRREAFDVLVARVVNDLAARWPAVASIEFATEDVPPSSPAQWEDHSNVLARLFPADRRRALADRIVVYRLPIMLRSTVDEAPKVVRRVLAERISHVLAIPPDELDDALS
ncbi:metallopeptidase family protein [Schaalia sp. 19OD2882]|uniref:metallopeptidase family protein n=1 Tax=Schaalia sp. 19OD2882 TaxID=2794089 RepID=UPI0034669985